MPCTTENPKYKEGGNSEHFWGEGLVEVCPAPLKAQHIEKVGLVTQNIPGEVLRHFR